MVSGGSVSGLGLTGGVRLSKSKESRNKTQLEEERKEGVRNR